MLVCAVSGAGKTTFARALAERLALPFHEMDALFHGPGWQPIPSFVADVSEISDGESWVFDSPGYTQVRDLVWARADAAIWLDYSRAVVLRRVVTRSTLLALTGEPVFNGNVERFADWVKRDHPVQWSMTRYASFRHEMDARFGDAAHDHIEKVRLRRPAAASWWLDRVQRST